ncbi:hypothetical protein AX14_011107, partial [Amanita brunnescens Koide BX004]
LTYCELIWRLWESGFVWHQYSDYCAKNINPFHVWQTMWSLCLICPLMKLQTTIQGLKMQYYAHLHLLDITNDV